MIVITLEGGLVSSVTTDHASVADETCVVVDYDTEGADEGDVCRPFGGDEACCHREDIGVLLSYEYANLEAMMEEGML